MRLIKRLSVVITFKYNPIHEIIHVRINAIIKGITYYFKSPRLFLNSLMVESKKINLPKTKTI